MRDQEQTTLSMRDSDCRLSTSACNTMLAGSPKPTSDDSKDTFATHETEISQQDDDVENMNGNVEAQNTIPKESDPQSNKKICCITRKTLVISFVVLLLLGVIVAVLFPKLLPVITRMKAIDELDVSDETAKILRKLNPYVSVFAVVLTVDIESLETMTDEDVVSEDFNLGWKRTIPSSDEYGWTPVEVVFKDSDSRDINSTLFVEHVRVSEGFSYDIIPTDDVFGLNEDVAAVGEFLTNCRYLPMKDNIHYFESEQARQDVMEDLRLLPLGLDNGYLNPIPVHEWEEMGSDEALSRIFWYGIGAVLIMGPEFNELHDDGELVGFEIDLDISSLPVREDFRPYGFRIQFDLNQKVTSIYDPARDQLVFPGDREWEQAKFLVKQTVGMVVTVREHSQWSHLLGSNNLARASQVHLPPNHPIRRLLSIFTFRVNKVNSNSQAILSPEKGAFHRMSAFEFKGLVNLLETGYAASDIFRPFRDAPVGAGVLALAEEGKFPYYKEGMEFFMIVHQFVTNWIAEAGDAAEDEYAFAFYEDLRLSSQGQKYEVPSYSKENMIDEIAQLIWVVTAYHQLVGNVAEYTQRPDFMGFRVAKAEKAETVTEADMLDTSSEVSKVETDTEAFLLAAYVAGVTGYKMPQLIGEFPNFIGKGDGIPAWEVTVWSDFQDDLRAQSSAVKAADAARIAAGQPEFKLMDPGEFECSTSL